MDYRAVILIGSLALGALTGAQAGCRAPDPGSITFAERPASGSTDPTTGTPAGGGSDAGGSTADPIFGTEAYVYVDPGLTANNAATEHQGTVEGKDCVVTGCHLDAPAAPKWLIAGTIYSAINGGTTVARAEVKVVGPDGTEVAKAFADANGNFFLDKAGDIPAGSKVGVRTGDGGTPQHMTTTLAPGQKSCNSTQLNCHGTPTTGHISAN
jgi:hypothetical protein